ncbi:MAG: hypothetical protein ACLRS8_18110 [Parabacteroides merdae]
MPVLDRADRRVLPQAAAADPEHGLCCPKAGERFYAERLCIHVSFQNERPGSCIYGILIVPKKTGKYPAVLQVPGAGIRPYNGFNLGEDIITLEIGIHGVPKGTMPQEVYNNPGKLEHCKRI